jgi:hypothetical protein
MIYRLLNSYLFIIILLLCLCILYYNIINKTLRAVINNSFSIRRDIFHDPADGMPQKDRALEVEYRLYTRILS